MSVISIKQLLEAGVHFGHQTRKWNPKMKKYIFTSRNDIHILDLETTAKHVDEAYAYIKDVVASGKSVLFVGTKKQAQEPIKEEATRCGMYYVNSRWLGGTLTNFKTIKLRIERLNKLNQMEKTGEFDLLPKKEVAKLKLEREKLENYLGGIKDMTEFPGVIFVVDPGKEHICVREAKILGIPLVGIVDTNCDPSDMTKVIPGNDDAVRSVKLIVSAMADACIEAREGVAPDKEEKEEEAVDAKALLNEELNDKPVEKVEEQTEVKAKKPRAKKVKEEEKVEEKKETSENKGE